MKKIMIIALAASMLVVSCKKEDNTNTNNNNPQPTKKEMLTAKPWKLTSLVDENNNDIFPTFNSCDKDNQDVFKADGAYQYDGGSVKCNSSDPQIRYSGTWSFTNSETKLSIANWVGSRTGDLTIKELTSTKLVLQDDYSGHTTIYTYTNQ